tara:strand:- start:71 stop:499 length:429 start_codon:yes stop_codon:yes gene_type:complete
MSTIKGIYKKKSFNNSYKSPIGKKNKITSRHPNIEFVAYYRVPDDDKICKILYLKNNGVEHFWLYRGECLCHARQHEGSKKPVFPYFDERDIYNLEDQVIGEVISSTETAIAPIELTIKDKSFTLFLNQRNKNTQTLFKLSY